MSPQRKQTRGNRTVKTPKRYKNGACVNAIVDTPTRGSYVRGTGANADSVTPEPSTISETTKQMSNKEKFDYLAGQMDNLMIMVTMLTNFMKGRKINIVNNLAVDSEVKDEEE